jgi:ribosomal protein S18 acetylase RimI-like enzyme
MGIKIVEINTNIRKTDMLDKLVYQNFIKLVKYPETKHNMKEIRNILNSKETKICTYLINNKIASYMIYQKMDLRGRRVVFLYYIYTAIQFRNKGIGKEMMNYLEEYTKHNKYDGIMLTCDTEGKENEWYLMKSFMPDILYRTYSRFDSLYKSIN